MVPSAVCATAQTRDPWAVKSPSRARRVDKVLPTVAFIAFHCGLSFR